MTEKHKGLTRLFLVVILSSGISAYAIEAFHFFPLKALNRTVPGQSFPENDAANLPWMEQRVALPWAQGSDGSEIVLVWADEEGRIPTNRPHNTARLQLWVAIRTPGGSKPKGSIFLPPGTGQAATILNLSPKGLPADTRTDAKTFWIARRQYYKTLSELSLPGQAIFAAETRQCDRMIAGLSGISPSPTAPIRSTGSPQNELQKTFAFFSGTRALSENLQLNRPLLLSFTSGEQIQLESLQGINTLEMDWKPLLSQIPNHREDALASLIPADQPGCFFSDFPSMIALFDEIDAKGFPLLSLFTARTENAHLTDFYRRQLSLPNTETDRWLGRMTIRSVALTASDPFVMTGTDLAIIFETDQQQSLLDGLRAQRAAAKKRFPSARTVNGQIQDLPYEGMVSPDRRLSSFLVPLGKHAVLVTNSLVQCQKIITTRNNREHSLATLDEYRYFRSRYPRDANESLFVMISDRTIRKWCGPRWRIADSRRTRALALLKQIWADTLIDASPSDTETATTQRSFLGELKQSEQEIQSSIYGNLRFMTPISEIEFTRISQEEAKAYNWYRDQYQKNWRRYFDPIALQLTKKGKGGARSVNLSVLPLIISSDYHPLMVAAGAEHLQDGQGDRHKQALGQFAMALDQESRPMREVGKFMSGFVSSLGGPALNWLGNWLTLYGDDGPFWDEWLHSMQNSKEMGIHFIENNLHRMPLALAFSVRDPLKLALFLSGLRRYIEQSAPGMAIWEEQKTADGDRYVTVRPTKGVGGAHYNALRIHYATTQDSFLMTLSEQVVLDFFSRRKSLSGAAPPWPGKSASFIVRPKLMKLLFSSIRQRSLSEMRAKSWSALPILNEYQRRFGSRGKPDLYAQHWILEPLCPGGKGYLWNEHSGAYESITFGNPQNPRIPEAYEPLIQWANEMSFGLTFFHGGLEIMAEIVENEP